LGTHPDGSRRRVYVLFEPALPGFAAAVAALAERADPHLTDRPTQATLTPEP